VSASVVAKNNDDNDNNSVDRDESLPACMCPTPAHARTLTDGPTAAAGTKASAVESCCSSTTTTAAPRIEANEAILSLFLFNFVLFPMCEQFPVARSSLFAALPLLRLLMDRLLLGWWWWWCCVDVCQVEETKLFSWKEKSSY
jgi:hypothetical protein